MQKYSLQGKEYDGCIYLAVIYTIIFFSLAVWIIIDQPLILLPLKLVLVLIPGIMIYMVVGSHKSFILVPIKKELLRNMIENILKNLSSRLKEHNRLQDLVGELSVLKEFDKNKADFKDLYSIIEKEGILPVMVKLLKELSVDPKIVENIEKDVIPLLFSS